MKGNLYGAGNVAPFDSVFKTQEWTTVIKHQLINSFKFFDADPNVITGFNFRLDALLNGGIIFKRKHKEMKGDAKNWMSQHFSRFCREIVRHRWCAGFVACAWVPDSQYTGRPIVLDLTQVTVKYKLSIFGEPEYRYFFQQAHQEVEIEDVVTFSFDPPDAFGNLRSLMLLLAPDLMQETMINYYSLVAMKGRALPVMVTEKDKEVYDKDDIRAPMARSPQALGLTKGGSKFKDENSPDRSMAIIHQTEQYYENTNPAMSSAIVDNIEAMMQVPYFQSHMKLEQGRRFVAPPMPDGPTDLMLQFRVARQERAFSLMGVPLAMVSNNTSTGSSKLSQGTNPNTFVLFDNAQQALKLELINIIKTMFYSIHLQAHLEQYLQETDNKSWNMKDAAESVEVIVEMPSMPNEESLIAYYTNGWLTYEALTRYLASKHGIAPSSFHIKPQLTVKEANGEFADPPAAKKAKK